MPEIRDQIVTKCSQCNCNELICKGIILYEPNFLLNEEDFEIKINQCFKSKIHHPEFNMNLLHMDTIENLNYKRDLYCFFTINATFLNEFESIKRYIFDEKNNLIINEQDINLKLNTGPILWISNSKQEFILSTQDE